MKLGHSELIAVEITNEVLDKLNELACSATPTPQIANFLNKADYRRAQQLHTLMSLERYIRELGLEPQFSIKVTT